MVEAVGIRKGEIRTADVQAVFGDAAACMTGVDVVVIGEAGTLVHAHLELTRVPAGPRSRLALSCGGCGGPCHVLYAREGHLRCRRCHPHRNRRQMERHLASWNRLGGREEDLLIRLLLPSGRRPRGSPSKARGMVTSLLAADRARVARFRSTLKALTVLVATRA